VTGLLVILSSSQRLVAGLLVKGREDWYENSGTKILVRKFWYENSGTKILVRKFW
jgi:hypothetical protein